MAGLAGGGDNKPLNDSHSEIAPELNDSQHDKLIARIVAWNINARIQNVDLRLHIEEALLAMHPGIIVLTEYVASSVEHERFTKVLELLGFQWHVTPHRPRQNRLFLASKFPISAPIEPKGEAVLAANENYLAVEVSAFGYEFVVIGLRIPAYSPSEKNNKPLYADWLVNQLGAFSGQRALVVGDLNFDPEKQNARHEWIYAPIRQRLQAATDLADPIANWYFCSPSGYEPSFWKGSRIDHGLRTHAMMKPVSVEYVSEVNGRNIMTISRPSDHAALVIDFDLKLDSI